MKPRDLLILLMVLIHATTMAAQPLIPTTNTIPPNLFLTDESRLFWYRKGERLIETRRIEEALKSKECRPAAQDPEGHWGQVTRGFQLSLRFDKQQFTNGEPVVATIFMRNVSTNRLSYLTDTLTTHPAPVDVLVQKTHEALKLKTETAHTIITGTARMASLYPQTQHKYRVRLDRYYDLSEKGVYNVRAEYDPHPLGSPPPDPNRSVLASQEAPIEITGPGISQAVANAPQVIAWGPASNYVQMSIDLDTAAATNKPALVFPMEEPRSPQEATTNEAVVILSVRLRNVSTNLTFQFLLNEEVEWSSAPFFEVILPSGKEVATRPKLPDQSSAAKMTWRPPPNRPRHALPDFIRLGPGQLQEFKFHLNRFCNFSQVGTYRVVGKWKLETSGSTGAIAEPISNPLQILVSRNPWKAEKIEK